MVRMEKQDFCIRGNLALEANGELRVAFKEPITIPQNAQVVVYWGSVEFTPGIGYLNRGFSILADLPLATAQNLSNIAGTDPVYTRKILLNMPPQNQIDYDADDPVSLPATGVYTYEPYTPVVHLLENQQQQINSITLKVVDLEGQNYDETSYGSFNKVSVAFCIKPTGGSYSV